MRIALVLVSFLAACSSDSGKAPAISALIYAPATVTVGQQSTVTGSMTFDDEDGDVSKLTGEVTLPNLTKQMFVNADLQALGEMTHGSIPFAITIVAPAPGAYAFELWITDDGDNKSNRLPGTLTAQ